MHRLKSEAIVLVEALAVKAFQEVKTCTVSNFELQVEKARPSLVCYVAYAFCRFSLKAT